jgi:ankyrin repeat protein
MFNDTILIAALNNHLPNVALKILLNGRNVDVSDINAEGDYPLILACKFKYTDLIIELLKRKNNPCQPDIDGETPLMCAVSDVNMNNIVKLLIDKNVCDGSNYKKEMMRILEVGNFEAFKMLLDVPDLGLDSYVYGNDSKLTLLEYIFISDLGSDYSENHRYAQELLKKTNFGCNPLQNLDKSLYIST